MRARFEDTFPILHVSIGRVVLTASVGGPFGRLVGVVGIVTLFQLPHGGFDTCTTLVSLNDAGVA